MFTQSNCVCVFFSFSNSMHVSQLMSFRVGLVFWPRVIKSLGFFGIFVCVCVGVRGDLRMGCLPGQIVVECLAL